MTEAARVRAFWRALDLPGLLDLHVHFLPPPIERAVWREFDTAGAKIGRPWPITYRQPPEERVALLRDFGVRRFTTLPYAHKPGVATYLNDWSRDFAAAVPEAVWTATFFPEPEAPAYVEALLAAGVRAFKVHAQVGEFHVDDPALDPVWGMVADAGVPVVAHVGSGPVGNAYTGPAATARLLARHPRLVLVVAHMGSPECAEFLDLAERHDGVHLDTSMAFSDFFADTGGYPRALLPRLRDLEHRVLYGSDFPTLPFTYADQLDQLAALGLGEQWLRAVCWDNASRLLGRDGNDEAFRRSGP